MPVVDVSIPKKFAQGLPIELGVVPGTGNGTDIYYAEDAIISEEFHKFIQGPGRMTHREDYGARFRRLIPFCRKIFLPWHHLKVPNKFEIQINSRSFIEPFNLSRAA